MLHYDFRLYPEAILATSEIFEWRHESWFSLWLQYRERIGGRPGQEQGRNNRDLNECRSPVHGERWKDFRVRKRVELTIWDWLLGEGKSRSQAWGSGSELEVVPVIGEHLKARWDLPRSQPAFSCLLPNHHISTNQGTATVLFTCLPGGPCGHWASDWRCFQHD